MLDECFLGQFHQPKRVSATVLGKTHENPKNLNTKLHNLWVLPQWSSKWSTVSPLQRHIMHQSTKCIPLPFKLSPCSQTTSLTYYLLIYSKTMTKIFYPFTNLWLFYYEWTAYIINKLQIRIWNHMYLFINLHNTISSLYKYIFWQV